jgi:hypothetical protein
MDSDAYSLPASSDDFAEVFAYLSPQEDEEHVSYLVASEMIPREGGHKMASDDVYDEKLGRAEDRWMHAQELHDQKMESMFEKFDERMKHSEEERKAWEKHSEELNRALIKNIGENTERLVKSISERTDRLEDNFGRLEDKFDRLEIKMDDYVKEIKVSNSSVKWAVTGLVATVLIGLLGVIVTLAALVYKI